MKPIFGLVLPTGFRLDLPKVSADEQYKMVENTLRRAESLGYHSAWLYDHFYTYPAIERESVFEAWITLTALAKASSRIRIGTIVTCNSYRTPTLLAKMSSTFDVVSGGRMELGLGAGWYEKEYVAYGYEFPSNATRIKMLEEAAIIIKGMWTEDEFSFSGKYYNVVNAMNYPKPLQKPRPRLLIGGNGEKLTLRVVARQADRWNGGGDPETYRRKVEILNKYIDETGRKRGEIELTYHGIVLFEKTDKLVMDRLKQLAESWKLSSIENFSRSNPVGSSDAVSEFLGKIRDAGAQYFMLYLIDSQIDGKLELFKDSVLNNI